MKIRKGIGIKFGVNLSYINENNQKERIILTQYRVARVEKVSKGYVYLTFLDCLKTGIIELNKLTNNENYLLLYSLSN